MKPFVVLVVLINIWVLCYYLMSLLHNLGDLESEIQWKYFKIKHAKQYNDLENIMRHTNFIKNSKIINDHNERFKKGLESFEMGINKFADLYDLEYSKIANGFNSKLYNNKFEKMKASLPYLNTVEVPDQFNWTACGAVTGVKDQGFCGSCWAFAAIGALEGQYFKYNRKLITLSEQNLIDCSWFQGNNGCYGGTYDYAYEYVRDNGGINTENCYPYVEEDYYICRYNKSKECFGVGVRGWFDLQVNNENELKNAVAIIGPISIAVDASSNKFKFYQKGIYYDSKCCEEGIANHAMLVVGYGTDENTKKDYWIVKNSWGTKWGENGYIRIARNEQNQCCITKFASFPITELRQFKKVIWNF